MISHEYTKNGGIVLTGDAEYLDDIATIAERGGDDFTMLHELLDSARYLGNGWRPVPPEEIGALTEAPILEDPNGRFFWFPNYMLRNFLEELAAGRPVFFVSAD